MTVVAEPGLGNAAAAEAAKVTERNHREAVRANAGKVSAEQASTREAPATMLNPAGEAAPLVAPTTATEQDRVRITVAEAAINDEAAKKVAVEAKTAPIKGADRYAIDRIGEKDKGVPADQRFRLTKAMAESEDYQEKLAELIKAESEKPSKQRLQQLQIQAARICYYNRAEASIAQNNGESPVGAADNPVFQKAVEREMARAMDRAKAIGEKVSHEDIRTRALAELMAAEDIKKDKSLFAAFLKFAALFGLGSAISFSGVAKDNLTAK